jgi:hypothetical protein
MLNETFFNTILLDWIPYGFGLIGIIVFLVGVVKLITNKDNAFSNMFTGIVVVLIAIGFKILVANFVLPNL